MRSWILRISICLILGAIIAIASAWGLSWYWFTKDKQASELTGSIRSVLERREDGMVVIGILSRFGSQLVNRTTWDSSADLPRFTDDPSEVPYWSRARNHAPRGGPEQERAFGFPFMCMSYEIDVLMPDERNARREEIRRRRRDAFMSGQASPEELAKLRDAERAELDALSKTFATYIDGREYAGARQVNGGSVTRYTYGAWPLRPIWPGLVANAAFWSAILFLLFFCPGLLRQFIRRRRGACLNCGYLLRGDYDAGCPECGWGRESKETESLGDGGTKP